MSFPFDSFQRTASASATLEMVHALCANASDAEVLQQGMFVYEKVKQARKRASRTKLGYIASTSRATALLEDPKQPVEASDFEIAQRLLEERRLLAEALAISPTTHPLVTYTGATIALANYLRGNPPLWVEKEASPMISFILSATAENSARSLRDIEEALREILPLARTGRKFHAGRKKEGYGPLRKWIQAYIEKNPKAENDEVWFALAKAKPRWVEFPNAKPTHREVWIGNDLVAQWPYFRNLVALCKRELKGRSLAENKCQ